MADRAALAAKSFVIDSVLMDRDADRTLDLTNDTRSRACGKIDHRSALRAIKVLVPLEHAVVTRDITGELHFTELSFLGEQPEITVHGPKRDRRHRVSCLGVNLVGRRMLPRLRNDVEDKLALPGGATFRHNNQE